MQQQKQKRRDGRCESSTTRRIWTKPMACRSTASTKTKSGSTGGSGGPRRGASWLVVACGYPSLSLPLIQFFSATFRYFRFWKTRTNRPAEEERNERSQQRSIKRRLPAKNCSRNEVVHAGGDGDVQEYAKEEDVFEWHRDRFGGPRGEHLKKCGRRPEKIRGLTQSIESSRQIRNVTGENRPISPSHRIATASGCAALPGTFDR